MVRCIFLLAFVTAAFGQSPDTVLTQTLITEIRALRQDIEATTIASQRVQIALYRLQSQTALMAGAQQRLDAARQRVLEVQTNRRHMTDELAGMEERSRNFPDGPQKKEFEAQLPRIKAEIEGLAVEESQRRSAEVDAETQFRAAQGRLAETQALLDQLDKALDDLGRAKK